MFLGGDQYRNDLSNNVIIKCHVCGNTDLRYLGYLRTPSTDQEKPYVCGNGHETWGALDDWSIKGGTDKYAQEVDDCCCEGIECEFPQSIFVQFSGIIGVQARESSVAVTENQYSDSLSLDFASRTNMPYNMCYPCTTLTFTTGDGPEAGQIESYSCGGFYATASSIGFSGEPQEPATIWPWRIPTFTSAGYGGSPYQLYYNKQTGYFDGSIYASGIAGGSCGCLDDAPDGNNPRNTFGAKYCGPTGTQTEEETGGEIGFTPPECLPREHCTTDIYYPPCLEAGTYKCSDVDAKYRVPCENPTDNYIINLGERGNYSYGGSVDWIGPARTPYARCDFSIFLVSGVVGTPPSPCADLGYEGTVNAQSLLGNPIGKFEQPNCLRRVKSPSALGNYYAVNTEDISKQTIILDRYYRTGGSVDYQWDDTIAKPNIPSSGNDINNFGDIGYTDAVQGRYYPYPFTAHSGSLTEPELVAIIHSESGVGGQIAFDTFPVSYDSDDLMDVAFDYFKPLKGRCEYKHRITVHGYGVKYPLIDDPIWKEDDTYDYPVFLKGKNYKIGDKIEFRCWKVLYDSEGNPIDDLNNTDTESVWSEECRELIVAKATVTEVDDNGGILWYEFDETDDNDDLLMSVGNCPCDYDLCSSPQYLNGSLEWDVNFNPSIQCKGCLSKDVYPSKNHKVDALPNRLDENLLRQIPGKFPGYPNLGCIATEREGQYQYDFCQYTNILGKPYGDNGTPDCQQSCQWTLTCLATDEWGKISATPSLFYEDDCVGTNCYCQYADGDTPCGDGGCPDATGDPAGTTYPSKCLCSPYSNFTPDDPAPYVLPAKDPTFSTPPLCFPKNNTWEWHENNYARSACSGEPVTPEQRPYMDDILIIPPKKAQYKYKWIPKVECTLSAIEDWVPDLFPGASELDIATEKDQFLLNTGEGCNPLNIDVYGKSYKFPLKELDSEEIDKPCRVQNRYQGIGTLYVKYTEGSCEIEPTEFKFSDNYCRVYGFYQQRQPTCDVVYKGQYIMRAAQKRDILGVFYRDYDTRHATDCEPIIDNITITLTKKEAKFDVSVGAPYIQDFLIPEQLPAPQVGPDGKLECTADPWNHPSLNGNDNSRLFNHGFYAPTRKYFSRDKIIPGESLEGFPEDTVQIDQIYPEAQMWELDGYDLITINEQLKDMYIKGQWDLPDPRSNVRIGTFGLEEGDPCVNPSYAGVAFSGFVKIGTRTSWIDKFPYPWETNVDVSDDDIGEPWRLLGGVPSDVMFKNNSAEIVLGSVKECDYCSSNEMGIFSPTEKIIIGTEIGGYDTSIYYTHKVFIRSDPDPEYEDEGYNHARYLVFRCFGSSEGNFFVHSFVELLEQYAEIWMDRLDINLVVNDLSDGEQLYLALLNDTERSVFWNFIFNGANNDKLDNLTKVEVIRYEVLEDEDGNAQGPKNIGVLYEEKRCELPKRAGSIESLIVQNPGEGYAFEIEERVPPTGVYQVIPGATISVTTEPHNLKRRAESYRLSSVNIEGSGCCYEVGDIVELRFNDTDYRGDGILYGDVRPAIRITAVEQDGVISDWEIERSGTFFKYMGTGQHRAFPVSVVVNNYWNIPGITDDSSKLGKHALFRPVIGVDPSDPDTYGKIKRVEVEYGGIEYVEPNVYWSINTTAGTYDEDDDLISGLDIQHLVDPCKYEIDGNGMSSEAVAAYREWYTQNGFGAFVETPGDLIKPEGIFDDFNEIRFPDRWRLPKTDGTPSFKDSTKYYYKTHGNQNIKWSDKVKSWSTVIQSGFCPFGPDGLLNRTYDMALVEEIDLTGQDANADPWRPFVGTCSQELCDYIINDAPSQNIPDWEYNDIEYPGGPANGAWLCNRMPGVPDPPEGVPLPNIWMLEFGGDTQGAGSYSDCHYLGCNVFTVYDTHRFPIVGVYGAGTSATIGTAPGGWNANRRPKIQGCLGSTIPVNGDWCAHGYQPRGFIDISEQLSQDKCFSAEYSMFAEFAKYLDGTSLLNVLRGKVITYKMKDPITMKISYNDNDVPVHEPCGDAYCLTTITNFSYVDKETIYSEFSTFEELCKKYCGEDGWNPTGNSCSCDFDCPGDGCSYSIVPGECT